MTTDLSNYDASLLPNADVLARQRYAIIVADWNSDITFALAQGAIDTLVKHGVKEEHISVTQSVTEGVTILNAGVTSWYGRHVPVIFSVLTTLNKQQALDRAGGKLGNKVVEGAVTAIRMANMGLRH